MVEITTKSPKEQTYDQNLKEAQRLLRTVFPDSKSQNLTGALKEYRSAAKLTDDPKASSQAVMAQTVESLRANAASSTIIKPQASAADRIPTNTPAGIAAANPVKTVANPGERPTMQNDPRSLNTAATETPATPTESPATVASASPANASTLVARDHPLETKNTSSKDMLQMLFLAIAQMLGINLTSMQMTQAGQAVKPPVVSSTVTPVTAKDPAIRPALESNPQPSSGAELAADDLLPQKKRAFEATLTPEQKQILESAHQNRDGDRLRSSREKEKDWNDFEKQLSDDQKLIFQQISAQAYPDRANTTTRADAFHPDRMIRTQYNPATASSADAPGVVRGLTAKHEQHMQILAQGDVGISGRNSPSDKAQILEALRTQAANDPNFASKLDALNTMKVGIQIGTGSTKIDKNAYEIKIDPGDLAKGAPILDIAIGKVVEGKQFNIDSLKADSERGGYKLPPSMAREINRDQRDIDRLQGTLPEARVGRPVPAAPQVVPEKTRAPEPSRYNGPTNYGAVNTTFNNASGQDQLNQTLYARAELRAQGYTPEVAKQLVAQERKNELMSGGYDDRSAQKIVSQETRLADTQERGMQQQARQNDQRMDKIIRQGEQAYRRDVAEQKRDNREFDRGIGTLGGAFSALTGGNYREMRAAREIGVALPATLRAFGFDVRDTTRVYTYPDQRQRGGYAQQERLDQGNFSLQNGNQITPRMNSAASDGVTEQQRADIIRNYEALRNAPTAEPATRQYRQPSPMDNFTGG